MAAKHQQEVMVLQMKLRERNAAMGMLLWSVSYPHPYSPTTHPYSPTSHHTTPTYHPPLPPPHPLTTTHQRSP